ncbi:MAG: hypothetical protein V1905_03190 [bacterium]
MFRKGEFIGDGSEKQVYENLDDPETVIAEIDDSAIRNNRQLKSAYYLQKIRHCLFPDNFPDIHVVFRAEKNILVSEKIKTEPGHRAHYLPSWKKTSESSRLENRYFSDIEKDPRRDELEQAFKEAGLFVDITTYNYSHDSKGNIVNLDIETGWDYYAEKIAAFFKPEKVRVAIDKIPDEITKRRASHYLDRLEQLLTEEKQSSNDTVNK